MNGYQNIRAKLYDARVASRNIEDVPFYIQEAKKTEGPVLELACGTGRILIPIAESGIEIVGLEASSDMLNLAKEKVSKLTDETQNLIELIQGDMCNFSLGRTFNTILIPFRSFQHVLTPEDQRKSLLCIKEHLTDNGRLIIHIGDVNHFAIASSAGGTPIRKMHEFLHPETENRVIFWWSRECDVANQISTSHYIFEEIDAEGQTLSRDHVFEETRHTFRYEMQYLFELCGFQVLELWGDFNRGPYRQGKEQIWLVQKDN